MSHPAFFLKNGHLTYDASKPDLCTDHPAICYGVPVPAPTIIGPTGGWGGGKTLNREELPPSVFDVDTDCGFAKAITKKLLDCSKALDKNAPADPLTKPRQPGPEYALREKVNALRGQVSELRDALAEANRRTMVPWALFQRAAAEIERLNAAVTAGERELAGLRAEVAAQHQAIAALRAAQELADPEAAVRYTYVPLPQLTRAQFEALHRNAMAGLLEGAPVAAAPVAFPWAETALAVAGLVAAGAFPKSWKGAKAASYSVSAAAGLSAVVKIIRALLRAA